MLCAPKYFILIFSLTILLFTGCLKEDTNQPDSRSIGKIDEFRNGTQPELLTEESKKAWNGIIHDPFIEGHFWAIWYNKEVGKKIGIEVKQYGMTFNDFTGYLKAAHNHNIQKTIRLYYSNLCFSRLVNNSCHWYSTLCLTPR